MRRRAARAAGGSSRRGFWHLSDGRTDPLYSIYFTHPYRCYVIYHTPLQPKPSWLSQHSARSQRAILWAPAVPRAHLQSQLVRSSERCAIGERLIVTEHAVNCTVDGQIPAPIFNVFWWCPFTPVLILTRRACHLGVPSCRNPAPGLSTLFEGHGDCSMHPFSRSCRGRCRILSINRFKPTTPIVSTRRLGVEFRNLPYHQLAV